MMEPLLMVVGFLAFFVVVFAIKGLKIIQQAETMIVERLGRFHRALDSGINILWPFFDQPRQVHWRYVTQDSSGERRVTITKLTDRIDLRETVYDFPRQNVITKDNVTMEIDALLYFQVTDAIRAVYEVANLPQAIEKLTQTTLRNVVGEMDFDECLASREIINTKLRSILDDATDKWGVRVTRVELQDITPPAEVQEAMEKQMRAERDRRAAILKAEGEKRAAILEAEGEKEAAINRAEGEKRATILEAEGEAEARYKIASAEAMAIMKLVEAFKDRPGDPANYLIAVRYIEALKEMAEGKENKIIYLPYEATNFLGSIGGIRDMFKG
ncbi:SPFH domain-containing protein [Desulfobotulus sp.]|jgi:regulator of protease activity HflC (stomatin/prohibitin superfamily)|uniref:SPFH domain-containing protein n=1 Tax=Desulfobotulus sp. TaxID=1940337 RepID=UPI002A360A61|nr:SPFH domain-containing protein [Desulfobotulus sp.]MDY0163784.1 SPFH domain-containing protein [Desulfobotulus sp.]